MNKKVAEIIDALAAHQDNASIGVLEELGTILILINKPSEVSFIILFGIPLHIHA